MLYRWAYAEPESSFDDANKLAKSVGVELDALAGEFQLLDRKGDKVWLPIFSERLGRETRLKMLQNALKEGALATRPKIDQLHLALYLWEKGDLETLTSILGQTGVLTEDDSLWRTAQALLEIEQGQNSGVVCQEAKVLAQLLGSKRTLLRKAETAQGDMRQLRFL